MPVLSLFLLVLSPPAQLALQWGLRRDQVEERDPRGVEEEVVVVVSRVLWEVRTELAHRE